MLRLAAEVGKLITAESGGEEFTPEAFCCGLEAAIRTGWANIATAECELGLSQGHFSAVLHSRQLLDLRLLLVICSHARVEPIDVLRGSLKVDDSEIEPLQVDWKRRRTTKSRRLIEREVPRILASAPDISYGAVVDQLGVAPERLERFFPGLANELRERQEFQARKCRWQRLLAFGRTLRLLKVQLEAEGRAFSHGTVSART